MDAINVNRGADPKNAYLSNGDGRMNKWHFRNYWRNPSLSMVWLVGASILAIEGCRPPTFDLKDKDLAAVDHFIGSHNKVFAYGGDVTEVASLTSINSDRMSVLRVIYRSSNPESASKDETIFHWNQLSQALISVGKESTAILFMLKPLGIQRIYDSRNDAWRRGPATEVEFEFGNESDALKFYAIFYKAAIKYGAKNISPNPKIADHRIPHQLSPKEKARRNQIIDKMRRDPGMYDRLYPYEQGTPNPQNVGSELSGAGLGRL